MITQMKSVLGLLSLLMFTVQKCRSVCVDPNTQAQKEIETEAVLGTPMKLTCISCMKREEIEAETKVDWYFRPHRGLPADSDIDPEVTEQQQKIYQYNNGARDEEGPWKGRLLWIGSKDLQDVSISIANVTMNDTGQYTCVVERTFNFNLYTPKFSTRIIINLVVREKASQDSTALYSEIMMYVLLVFLTLWLLVEMIYCYRKISKSDEQAQDSATDYLAIPSENKENPGPAVTE